jgi:hypothetical protein
MACGLKFFFDNCMSPRLARGLAELAFFPDDTIVHLRNDDRFTSESLDPYIYSTLAKDKPPPVFVTSDRAQKTRGSVERQALKDSGLTVVFFAKDYAHLDIHSQALVAIKAWPEIRHSVARCSQPTIFDVSSHAKVSPLLPTASLKA